MADLGKNEILLESGTNEMEILEFIIGDEIFGINVAKVHQIMIPQEVKPMPHAHPAIEGVFKPRDVVITVIDLPKYLGLERENVEKTLFIVTNFNQIQVAFRVHAVNTIDRVSWNMIEKPDKLIYGGVDGVATGIAQYEGKLITILDFEKIVVEISPATGIQMSEIDKLGKREVVDKPIVIAEDSVLLSRMLEECLHKAGYTNLTMFTNGQEAWDYLSSIANEEDVASKAALIITDIEMPLMDGHRLTKLVKTHKKLQNIPVIIFSSLINQEMYNKGIELGANEQMSKPEIGHLVAVIDSLIK